MPAYRLLESLDALADLEHSANVVALNNAKADLQQLKALLDPAISTSVIHLLATIENDFTLWFSGEQWNYQNDAGTFARSILKDDLQRVRTYLDMQAKAKGRL